MVSLGKAFPDFLTRGHTRRPHRQDDDDFHSRRRPMRLFTLVTVYMLTFVILEARLFHLTIVQGVRNRLRSEGNRVREEIIPAPRGIIFDRHGIALVRNIPFYREIIKDCPNDRETCERAIDTNEARRLVVSGNGGNLTLRIGREYLLGDKVAHLTGYIGEVSSEERRRLSAGCQGGSCLYRIGDFIGRGGIEGEYESRLRGVDGRELVEVDAQGNTLRTLGKVPEIAGNNLTLTIDAKLQELTSTLIASRSGALLVTIPQSGEVLALSSAPSFDPNSFILGDSQVVDILSSPHRPLFNRAISGTYPPGSTFKIVTATAALEEKVVTSKTKIEDSGVIAIGPYKFHNWFFSQYGKTEGAIDMVRALARSNDIYFYRAGEMLGVDKLSRWAGKFGLGKVWGLDLPGEEAGVVPNAQWKVENFNEAWYLGDTYHFAIGQGNLLTTPLQVNMFTNIIASGKICPPRLIKEEVSSCVASEISPETLETVREGLRQACSPGGTGWPLFKFKVKNSKLKIDGVNFLTTYESTTSAKPMIEIPVACKTGTAEYGDPKGRTHAWFTAFAPVKNPEISVTVLVEGGGEGSSVAGPIVKKIFEYWFSQ